MLCLGIIGMTASCRSQQSAAEKRAAMNAAETVPYTVMNNYFLKNNVRDISFPMISDEQEFNGLFGEATTMGPEGTPTPVDFSKEQVIAIVLPETDVATEIKPVRLDRTAEELKMYYTVVRGEKTTYTMRPILLVKISNKYTDEVVPVEVNSQNGKR